MPPTLFASPEPLPDDAPFRAPRPSRLLEPLEAPHKKAADALEALELRTVGDLLEHLPRDRREGATVAELALDQTATIVVEVRSITSRPVRRRGMRPLVEATVVDGTGALKATFFNQPWLVQRYPPGTRLALFGKYQGRGRFRVQEHRVTDAVTGAETVAVYAASEGITSSELHGLVDTHRAALDDVVEPLPARLRVAEHLPERPAALTAVHFGPRSEDGRRLLAFDELLLVQLLFWRRRARHAVSAAPVLDRPGELTQRWLRDVLPFTPTDDQREAMEAIDRDLAREHPMQRLLMGEVGSGKTVVALYSLLRAVEHGLQGALMAPTETLAEQHFATIARLMPGELVPVALLTGSTPAARRADILAKLASGELGLVVGTHALIEPSVEFDRLAVVVVDEQHRFGVRQRAALDRKGFEGSSPHVLHMTATPIPRTLRLLGYGELDHTVIRELPGGRKPIQTFIAATEPRRARAYERVREELRAGRQAFVVCPLVEESEVLEARAATREYERLKSTEFKDFRCVLLHGQMRPREKQEAMAAFAAGGADVLVATSVIEVGIDVPNATVMLVEDAERYGISQLHQLRGRIGRGGHASVCILFGPTDSARLRALEEHTDGFRLAEIDLELRKEGELVGTRQSGLGEFAVARMPEDEDLLERARVVAEGLLASDRELTAPEHALLADALRARYGAEELEPLPA